MCFGLSARALGFEADFFLHDHLCSCSPTRGTERFLQELALLHCDWRRRETLKKILKLFRFVLCI